MCARKLEVGETVISPPSRRSWWRKPNGSYHSNGRERERERVAAGVVGVVVVE